jgi:predicted NBD/HSP70 family sugar kinase
MAIIRQAEQVIENGLWLRDNNSEITFQEILDSAKSGQQDLVRILNRAGNHLGVGVSVLINIFNPEKIIISGQGVEAGDLIFKSMNDAINKHTLSDMLNFTKIVIPEWHHTDWAKGAASLVLQELYKSPFNTIRPVI